MKPIVLTEYGETLTSQTNVTDETQLGYGVHGHNLCGGFVDIFEVSTTHNALHCRRCGLRVVIPKEVDTLGKLQEYFCQFNP